MDCPSLLCCNIYVQLRGLNWKQPLLVYCVYPFSFIYCTTFDRFLRNVLCVRLNNLAMLRRKEFATWRELLNYVSDGFMLLLLCKYRSYGLDSLLYCLLWRAQILCRAQTRKGWRGREPQRWWWQPLACGMSVYCGCEHWTIYASTLKYGHSSAAELY